MTLLTKTGVLLLPVILLSVVACGRHEPPASIPLAPGIAQNLAQNPGSTAFWIDKIGSVTNPTSVNPIQVDEASDLNVNGWAIDKPAASVAGGVEMVLDGKPYQIPYGSRREDLIDALHNPAYADAGFQTAFPARALGKGTHTLTFRILAHDRKSYFPTPGFTVIVGS